MDPDIDQVVDKPLTQIEILFLSVMLYSRQDVSAAASATLPSVPLIGYLRIRAKQQEKRMVLPSTLH